MGAVTARSLIKRFKGNSSRQQVAGSESGRNACQKKSFGLHPPRPPMRRRTFSSSRERSCSSKLSGETSSSKFTGRSSSSCKTAGLAKKKVVYVKTWEHNLGSEKTGDFNNNDDIWVVIDMKLVKE